MKFPIVFAPEDTVQFYTNNFLFHEYANKILEERMRPLYLDRKEYLGLSESGIVRITAEKCEDNVSNAFVMWTLEPQPIVREPLKAFLTVTVDPNLPPDEIHLVDSTGKKVGVIKNFSVEKITESGRE